MASGVDVGAGGFVSFLYRMAIKDSSRDCYVMSVSTVLYKAHLTHIFCELYTKLHTWDSSDKY